MGETLETDLDNPQGPEEEEIARLGPWFHNLHLENGLQTAPNHPLGDFPRTKWREVEPHLPRNIRGWSVLDIGCNAGFYSFALARRGAKVTAIDIDDRYLNQARWAAKHYGLEEQVTFRKAQVYDLTDWEDTFDLVWFMGVLYHLRYPMLAMDIVARKTSRLLVLQTLSMPGREEIKAGGIENLDINKRDEMLAPGWPKMAFIEHRLAGDPTNWWAPNHACVQAMARSSGLEISLCPAHEIYLCKPKKAGTASDDPRADGLVQAQFEAATGIGRRPGRGG